MEEWAEVEEPTYSTKDGKWVVVEVVVRKNDSGEVRTFATSEILRNDESEPSTYVWRLGNNSCDCNRRLLFAETAGEDADAVTDAFCGEGAYSVRLRNPKTGRVYYSEFEPDECEPF